MGLLVPFSFTNLNPSISITVQSPEENADKGGAARWLENKLGSCTHSSAGSLEKLKKQEGRSEHQALAIRLIPPDVITKRLIVFLHFGCTIKYHMLYSFKQTFLIVLGAASKTSGSQPIR